MQLLIVTAVPAERDAVLAALPAQPARAAGVTVVAGGAGPVAAAVATARALAEGDRPDVVVSAGIGGGFAPLGPGDLVVASGVVFADLGAQTPDGFVPVSQLGFAKESYPVAEKLAVELADRTGARLGTVLTVATVTGTAQRADELLRRHPDAAAEAMEGAGVAAAAAAAGVPFAELRAISNVVGPRDRDAWRVPQALEALGRAVAQVVAQP